MEVNVVLDWTFITDKVSAQVCGLDLHAKVSANWHRIHIEMFGPGLCEGATDLDLRRTRDINGVYVGYGVEKDPEKGFVRDGALTERGRQEVQRLWDGLCCDFEIAIKRRSELAEALRDFIAVDAETERTWSSRPHLVERRELRARFKSGALSPEDYQAQLDRLNTTNPSLSDVKHELMQRFRCEMGNRFGLSSHVDILGVAGLLGAADRYTANQVARPRSD